MASIDQPTTSFTDLPEDILIQISQYSALSTVSALGRSSKHLYSTLNASLYPTHLTLHHPHARSLPLSPPPQTWPPPALLRHITQTSHRLSPSSRSFIARALPLPPSTLTHPNSRRGPAASSRGGGCKPLLAVGRTRVVAAGVGGRRGVLMVYELSERGEDGGGGEMQIEQGWEVSFGQGGIGQRDAALDREAREEGGDDGARERERGGLGGLLSADLTGMEFCGGSWCSEEKREGDQGGERDEERHLVLTFGNGVVQIVKLPSIPLATVSTPLEPAPPVSSNGNGRRRGGRNSKTKPSIATAPPPTLTLVQTLSHPPSPVQSLSTSSGSGSSSSHPSHILTASYSGLLSFHSSSSSSSSSTPLSTLQLPSSPTGSLTAIPIKPWSTLLPLSLSHILLGTSSSPSSPSPLSLLPLLPTGFSHPSLIRSLSGPSPQPGQTFSTNPSVYALGLLGGAREELVISGWSMPVGMVCLHDLRTGAKGEGLGERPVLELGDRWVQGESWYSVSSSEDGRTIFAGLATGSRIGIWDVRFSPSSSLSTSSPSIPCSFSSSSQTLSSLSLPSTGPAPSQQTFSSDASKGWTVFAPTRPAHAGSDLKEARGGEVGGLRWVGARLWGVTPSAPFVLDFSPPDTLSSSLFPSLGEKKEEEVVTFYDHTEAMELGKSERGPWA